MYQYNSFENGSVHVTHSEMRYNSYFRAATAAEASEIVAKLNLPLMLARLAAHRYMRETQGIEVNGSAIRTDRESQAQLNSVYTTLNGGFLTTTRWKGEDGWQDVDINTVGPMVQAMANHVDNCFRIEEIVEDQLRLIVDHTEMAAFNPEAEFDALFNT